MDLNPLATLDAVQPADLDTGPVVVLNLLKFKSPDSVRPYLDYIRGVSAACADSGIELIYAGQLKEQIQGDIGDWDVVLVVRYPSRRAFLDLVSDPRYLALAPYKFAALHLALVPVTRAVALPDPRGLVIAAAVIAFLAFGWWRSARRQRFP